MLLKAARTGLGYLIVLFDGISRPKRPVRSPEEQAEVQARLNGHSIYHLFACPFCVKTRRAIHKLGVSLEMRDIGKNQGFRQELESGGGRVKVPCLRIDKGGETQWMYESSEIIHYLQQRVG